MKKKFFGISAAVIAVLALTVGAVSAAAPQATLAHSGGNGNGEGSSSAIGEYMKAETADILGLTVEELDAAKEAGTPKEELLADAGLTQDEFKAAMEAAFPNAVAAALADGAITQEEADALLERGFRSPRKGGKKGGKGGKGDGALREYIKQAVADTLGLSVEEMEAAKESGTTMEDLLADAGMTQDEFQAAMETAFPGILDQAVADGVITQEQADKMAERGYRPPRKGGPGGDHGPRGGGERPEGAPQQDG